jgi:tetratricopeptide (TPR) repeat protein
MMFTLYDLLDADPEADKAALKEAFRKAAKISHPDVCPDDAEAPWRFRQIVRAHEILSDDELRAAYDHVVAFEQRMIEQDKPRRPILDNVLAKIVSSTIAAAVAGIALFSGYALSAYLSEVPVAAARMVDAVSSRPATDAAAPGAQLQTAGLSKADRDEVKQRIDVVLATLREVTAEAAVPAAANDTTPRTASQATIEATIEAAAPDGLGLEAAALGPVPDHARRDAKFFRTRGMLAYRFGDFSRAIANFDAAIRLDPNYERAYRDRAAALAITSRFERATADLARADRIRNAHPVLHTVLRRQARVARATVQDALWREAQRAHAEHLMLTSQSGATSWPAGG